MILKKHRPLYREVVKEALAATWQDKHLWIFALFAGILQTGGIYDVILKSVAMLTRQAEHLAALGGQSPLSEWRYVGPQLNWVPDSIAAYAGAVEGVIFGIIIILTVVGFSLICQGALAYGLAHRHRGQTPKLRICLKMGALNFWPIAVLNLISFGVIFLARLLVLIPYAYALSTLSWLAVIGYFIAFILFLAVVIGAIAWHMLALNIMAVENLKLIEALKHALTILKKGWLIVLELGGVLFAIGFALLLALVLVLAVAGIPWLLLLMSAAILQWTVLLDLLYGIGLGLALSFSLIASAGAICFQYACWQRIYVRVDQGHALAKFYRLLQNLFRRKG